MVGKLAKEYAPLSGFWPGAAITRPIRPATTRFAFAPLKQWRGANDRARWDLGSQLPLPCYMKYPCYVRHSCFSLVIPAKAGIHLLRRAKGRWTPAFAGVTREVSPRPVIIPEPAEGLIFRHCLSEASCGENQADHLEIRPISPPNPLLPPPLSSGNPRGCPPWRTWSPEEGLRNPSFGGAWGGAPLLINAHFHSYLIKRKRRERWIPAFAGMTERGRPLSIHHLPFTTIMIT
jgi:hypothetical protein